MRETHLDQLSFRLDDRLSSRHTAFARYAHDGSRSFANTTGTATTVASALPSNWVRELTWVDQSVLGVTSVNYVEGRNTLAVVDSPLAS